MSCTDKMVLAGYKHCFMCVTSCAHYQEANEEPKIRSDKPILEGKRI